MHDGFKQTLVIVQGDTVALNNLDDYFPDWKEREALAEAMIPLIGKLYRKNIVVYCYGRALYNQSVTKLMKAHRYVRQVAQNELSEFETFPLLQAIAGLDLGPCHIDLRQISQQSIWKMKRQLGSAPRTIARQECAKVVGQDQTTNC